MSSLVRIDVPHIIAVAVLKLITPRHLLFNYFQGYYCHQGNAASLAAGRGYLVLYCAAWAPHVKEPRTHGTFVASGLSHKLNLFTDLHDDNFALVV